MFSTQDNSDVGKVDVGSNTAADRLSADSNSGMNFFRYMVKRGIVLQEMKSESKTDSTSPMHSSTGSTV
jgi:hypothetical protein